MKKKYLEFYNFWKNFSMSSLEEIRRDICFQGKSQLNSLKLSVLDDLLYLKQYDIPV